MRAFWLAAACVACSSSGPPATFDRPEPAIDDVAAIAKPRIVAHRGASYDAPENTLVAFRRAWESGVECVELDVQTTRDGETIVFHDFDTKRIGKRDRRIEDQTLAELRELDAGAWKSPAFAGERIPTIAEALATIPRGRTLFIEIKSKPPTAKAIAQAIRAADPRPRGAKLALQGIDPEALAALVAELPDVPAFWTAFPPLDDQDRPLPYPREVIAEAVRRKFPGVALFHGSVTRAVLDDAQAAGILVDVWTVNDPRSIGQWLTTDVRWVETDRPDLVPTR